MERLRKSGNRMNFVKTRLSVSVSHLVETKYPQTYAKRRRVREATGRMKDLVTEFSTSSPSTRGFNFAMQTSEGGKTWQSSSDRLKLSPTFAGTRPRRFSGYRPKKPGREYLSDSTQDDESEVEISFQAIFVTMQLTLDEITTWTGHSYMKLGKSVLKGPQVKKTS